MQMTFNQTENVNEEIEIIKKNQQKSGVESAMTEFKKWQEGLKSRIELTEERIRGIEDKSSESVQSEEQKENEQSLKDLLDTIKHINKCIIGVVERKEWGGKELGGLHVWARKVEKILKQQLKTYQIWIFKINLHIQEAQWAPSMQNGSLAVFYKAKHKLTNSAIMLGIYPNWKRMST